MVEGLVSPVPALLPILCMLALVAGSLGLEGATPREMLRTFDVAAIPREPWIVTPPA